MQKKDLDKILYIKLKNWDCEKSEGNVCRSWEKELKISMLKTMLTITVASLLGTTLILFCYFYQVSF